MDVKPGLKYRNSVESLTDSLKSIPSYSSPAASTIKINVAPANGPSKRLQQNPTLESSIDSAAKKVSSSTLPNLKQQQTPDNNARKDRTGKVIERGSKKHHISFRDIIKGGNVADVNEVESYKQYNMDEEEKTTVCGCALL